MKEETIALDEQHRRGLQEYIFDLEEIKEQAEELTLAYEKVKSSQDLLLAVLGCTVHGLCLMKHERLVWCNQALVDILGWEHDELIGRSLEFLCAEAADCLQLFGMDNCELGRHGVRVQTYEFIHKKGHRVPCFISGRALDDRDLSQGCVYSITDVTEQNRSREDLQKAYDELARRSAELVHTNEQLNREIDERRRAEEQLSEYREQLEELVEARTGQLQAANRRLQEEILERRRMEECLKESQQRLADIIDFLPDATLVIDTQGRVIAWNRAMEAMTGIAATGMLGKGNYEHALPFYGERRPVLIDLVLKPQREIEETYLNVAKGRRSLAGETLTLNLRGADVCLSGRASVLRDSKGSIAGAIESIRDVTERKRAEEALAQAEEKYRSMFENAVMGIFRTTPEGRMISANPALAQFLGYGSPEEIVEQLSNVSQQLYVLPERRGELLRLIRENEIVREFEVQFYRKDGSIAWVTLNARAVRNGDREIVFLEGSAQDISDRKTLETRLLQAQKMEAMGTLAGGIAHDFNNILAAIVGYAELTKGRMRQPELTDYLDRVLQSCDRAKNLVRQILTFSRGVEEEKRPVDIRSLIREGIKLLRATLPATIEIRQRIDLQVSAVLADPTQLHQILMNLCTNSAYAMRDGGGVLEISLRDESLTGDKRPAQVDLSAGQYVRLQVSDTGTGIPSGVIHRIFDPFFTTKKHGEGTGLGLSMVYGIVKAYGGTVCVQSQAGAGSVFGVYIPAIPQSREGRAEPTEAVPLGHERVLLVEDEGILMEMGRDILEDLGYEVTTARDGVRALAQFRSQAEDFDLVITDMTMPGMTGADLARELLKVRPAIPIILYTGHSDLITEEAAKKLGVREYLMKPYSIKGLAEVIRRVLEP